MKLQQMQAQVLTNQRNQHHSDQDQRGDQSHQGSVANSIKFSEAGTQKLFRNLHEISRTNEPPKTNAETGIKMKNLKLNQNLQSNLSQIIPEAQKIAEDINTEDEGGNFNETLSAFKGSKLKPDDTISEQGFLRSKKTIKNTCKSNTQILSMDTTEPLQNQIKNLKKEIKETIDRERVPPVRKTSEIETNLTPEQQLRNQDMFERRMSINVAMWKQK